ncbi:MAG: hypothetical protein M3Q07_02320 [Pseudobdellovibrionaceae bacterium]|nr:hypothetical protein [Pseudobdellovibrionaceae bacterium]
MKIQPSKLIPFIFLLCMGAASFAQDSINPSLRGWRCKSPVKGACEQGLFNDIELLARRAYEDGRKASTGKASSGLQLESLRIGELSATAYLEGDVLSSPPYRSQLLELTFFPGQDIEGTGVASLGQPRFSLGDRFPDFKGPFLWETNQNLGRSVKESVIQDIRLAFDKGARQALGLGAGAATLPGAIPQTCWRGCGDKSEEKKFRDIAELTKSLFHDSRGIVASQNQTFKCSLYYPVGTKEVTFNHYDANGNRDIELPIEYHARMRMTSFEIFTDSAQAVLEGNININGDVQAVVYSVSFPIGNGIDNTGIAGLGMPWVPVGGPDSSTFWENGFFYYDFYNQMPIHRSEIGGRFPSEYHCFYPETVPGFTPPQNPGEYDKVLLRNKKYLRKDLKPIMAVLNEKIANSFTFAVKVHTRVGALTANDVSRYRSSYFDGELQNLSRKLKSSLSTLENSKDFLLTSRAVYAPLLQEATGVLANKDATSEQVLALRDKALRAADNACKENTKDLAKDLENLYRDYEIFLVFKDNSLILFQSASLTDLHEKLFLGAAPGSEDLERKIEEVEGLLSSLSPCRKFSGVLTGIFLKVEAAKLAGVNTSLQSMSDAITQALQEKAALYEAMALRSTMTTMIEQEAASLNDAISKLSLSDGLDGKAALLRLKNEDLLPKIVGSSVLSDEQKGNLTSEVESRVGTAVQTWQNFLQSAGGERPLVELRQSHMYLEKALNLRSFLLTLEKQSQKALLLNWFNTLADLDIEKPANCLDPARSLQSESLCWALDIPRDNKRLKDFDKILDKMMQLAEQMTSN